MSKGAVIGVSVGVVVVVVLLAAVILVGVAIIIYAYRHPTTPLGLFLIEVSTVYT